MLPADIARTFEYARQRRQSQPRVWIANHTTNVGVSRELGGDGRIDRLTSTHLQRLQRTHSPAAISRE
jgi:hypothetical protein